MYDLPIKRCKCFIQKFFGSRLRTPPGADTVSNKCWTEVEILNESLRRVKISETSTGKGFGKNQFYKNGFSRKIFPTKNYSTLKINSFQL